MLIEPSQATVIANKNVEWKAKTRVLVVDDDSGQRIVLKSMLVREGYEVEAVDDGEKVPAQALVRAFHVWARGHVVTKTRTLESRWVETQGQGQGPIAKRA